MWGGQEEEEEKKKQPCISGIYGVGLGTNGERKTN